MRNVLDRSDLIYDSSDPGYQLRRNHTVRTGWPEGRRHRAAGDQHLTDQELQTLPPQPLELDLPITTVGVERAVKVTTAAARVCADPTEWAGWRQSAGDRCEEENPRFASDVHNKQNV